MSCNRTSPCHLNPVSSDRSFKKSCDVILKRTKRFDMRALNDILTYDDPEITLIDNDKHVYVWYFAIGSMTNPISLYLRDITPLISYPAKCLDHRLVFRDVTGMADIEPCKGEEFHGVVHLLPIEQILCLDKIEHMYDRITVNIIDYEQRSHLVYVYKMTLIEHKERPKTIPTERYLDIIVKGCEYFGVCSSYINHLKHQQPVIPRKSSDTYKTIDNIPDNVYYTNDELSKHDGKDPSLPVWTSVNGKILEYTGLPPHDHPDYKNQKHFYEFILTYLAGQDAACAISKAWYEPLYKLPLNDEDMCNQHRAFAEDMCVSWGFDSSKENNESYWKPIGRLIETSKNDKSQELII